MEIRVCVLMVSIGISPPVLLGFALEVDPELVFRRPPPPVLGSVCIVDASSFRKSPQDFFHTQGNEGSVGH